MAKKISDRSREFTQQALQTLNSILQTHKACPDVAKMPEADRALLLQKLQQFGNAVAATKYKKFSFYNDAVKIVRNSIAHSTGDDVTEINGIFRNFFSWTDKAKFELAENIARAYSQNRKVRQFEKFSSAFGSEENRKLFADSIQNQFFDDKESQALKVDFENKAEQKIAGAASDFFNPPDAARKELLGFAKKQDGLFDSIQEEIVSWTDSVQTELTKNNPFEAEENFVQNLQSNLPDKKFPDDYAKIQSEYSNLNSIKNFKPNVDLEFYKKSFEENAKLLEQKNKDGSIKKSAQKEFEKQNEILLRNLLGDMQKELGRRKIAWELEQIEKARAEFLKQLYEKIEKFKKLMETLKSFTKNFGRLWDLAQGELQDCGFDILEKYADLLANDEGLQELAKMIGLHHEEEQKFHKELRSKIVVDTVYNPEPAFKGEISGLRLSDNLPDTLPAELGLYVNEKTRAIFKMKFAQKQLLSYAYTRNYEYQKTHEEQEEFEVGEPVEQKGPMIICVDTSGSMQGTPERVAKTVAFALAQKLLEEERGCYLISFSTGIETMDLSTFASADGLANLVKFLRMSFNGGTDANPALEHSVKLLEENETWKNADVLMISDFVMGNLGTELEEKIKAQKENKTRFFSLAVTDSGNNAVVSVFDKNWIYDTNARDAGAKLVRQLAEMEEARTEVKE